MMNVSVFLYNKPNTQGKCFARGVYALVVFVFVSDISLVRCSHSSDF